MLGVYKQKDVISMNSAISLSSLYLDTILSLYLHKSQHKGYLKYITGKRYYTPPNNSENVCTTLCSKNPVGGIK